MLITHQPQQAAVVELLFSAQLPTSDITSGHMAHFFGAWEGPLLIGTVGIEPFGSVALLRSLAVVSSQRDSGLGAALLAQAEQYASKQSVSYLFLLTTTAASYFEQHGYSRISRDDAPSAIQSTTEFTGLCPASAVLMMKHIMQN